MRKLTKKQREIMVSICEGVIDDDTGERVAWKDVYQLIDDMTYGPTRHSMHFSIEALEKHGLVEKPPKELREGRRLLILAPTEKALEMYKKGYFDINFEPPTVAVDNRSRQQKELDRDLANLLNIGDY